MNQRSKQAQHTIGLDIGYGVTKALTGQQNVLFPSVCGHAHELKFQADEIAERHPGEQITDEDGAWFVGSLALSQLRPGEILRLRGRTVDEQNIGNVFRVRMAKVAIGKLFGGQVSDGETVHLQLATGLPVDV